MNFDDLLSLGVGLDTYEKFFETVCNYGIGLEDLKDASDKSLFGDMKFHIKFSVPEFWGYELSNAPITKESVVSQFKDSFNSMMLSVWMSQDEDWDDDLLEECLKCLKYFCRVRKGETFHAEDREKALEEMKRQMEAVREVLDRQSGFEEV